MNPSTAIGISPRLAGNRAPAAAGWLAKMVERLQCYWRQHQESAQLLAMDDRSLHDIGISRVDAIREASRPAWTGCSAASNRRVHS